MADEPGWLATLAQVLAAEDANILAIAVHSRDGHQVADDLLVSLRRPLDLPHLALMLERRGVEVLSMRPARAEELIDPVVSALDLGGELALHPELLQERVVMAARDLVAADLAWMVNGEHPSVGGVAGAALTADDVRQEQEALKLLGSPSKPWLLAVPVRLATRRHALVTARSHPFAATETARLRALARLTATVAERDNRAREVPLGDGGSVRVRRIGPDDRDRFIRLHRRCSTQTLHRRYFTPAIPLSPPVIGRLVDPGSVGGVGLVAALGSEIVGVVQAYGEPGSSTAELGLLVEDGHQRRGIGALLLTRVTELLRARDVVEVTLAVLPDDHAVRPLLTHCGLTAESHFRDGLLHLIAPVGTGPGPDSGGGAVAQPLTGNRPLVED